MRRHTLVIAMMLFVFLLFSCTSKKKDAIEYNNKIVNIQTRISRAMIDLANTFESLNAGTMNARLGELLAVCNLAIKEAKSMEKFDGSSELRDSAIELFEFYDSISKKEYKEIVTILSGNITQESRDRLTEMQDDIAKRENALDDKFKTAQKNFVEKYNIPIIENKLQKEIDNLGSPAK